MKIVFIVVSLITLNAFVLSPGTISKKERKSAAKFLVASKDNALKTVRNLSEAQLKFRPAPDKWSVEDCMMHIAVSEKLLWNRTDSLINSPANPEKRAEIKLTDEELIRKVEDRSNKVKTAAPFEPVNSGFKDLAEAVTFFTEHRDALINYVKTSTADLRNHVIMTPGGGRDAYQMILHIGAHTNRHVKQMEEVMADPAFPKN